MFEVVDGAFLETADIEAAAHSVQPLGVIGQNFDQGGTERWSPRRRRITTGLRSSPGWGSNRSRVRAAA
jgi:hypothetical protein